MAGTYKPENTSNRGEERPPKTPILGQGHGLTDEEGQIIQQMISRRATYLTRSFNSQGRLIY